MHPSNLRQGSGRQACKQCGSAFDITDDDLAFYDKVSPVFAGKKETIPPPTLCPDCRLQRRFAFRNERSLFYRTCSLSGKRIISMHPPEAPFPVYDIGVWLGDQWDPLSYGRDVDFSRPFFEQMAELRDSVPHYNLYTDPVSNSNSDFTNCIAYAKDCYLCTNAGFLENCYYSRGILHSRDCSDCLRVHHCELCYECIDVQHCYRCLYLQDSDDCSDCTFSTGLRGCKSCFGCHGLVRREYCAFNRQLSEAEWKERYGSLRLTRPVIAEMRRRSEALRLSVPQRYASLVQCEDVTGDRCTQSRNCRNVFDSNLLEDCVHCHEISDGMQDCRDCSVWGERSQLFYECMAAGTDGFHCLFCDQIWKNNRDLFYCIQCFPNTADCFGCFSLHNHRYCILNKQYTQEEYEALVPKIIEKMRVTPLRSPDGSFAGYEWGEFFPIPLADYAYNQSIAHEYFPLSEEQVRERGWRWHAEPTHVISDTVSLPDDIADVTDALCDKVLTCSASGKPYKTVKQELAFYRRMGVPVPDVCFDERHKRRMQLRRPWKLWKRECMKCGKDIETSYSPDRPEIVYCEDCYLQEVY